MSELRGKVALVTGGIGLGMAEGLAKAGCDLVIWGSNPDKNAAAERILKAYKVRVLAQRCDVADETQVEGSFAAALEVMGRIDGCFASAGVSQKHGPFHELESAEWRRVLGVNLDGAFYTLRAAAKHMAGHGQGGALVGTASLAAISGQPRGEHYAATKGGLISMIRALAVEFARYGIRANAVLPGWIDTAMTEKALNWDKFRDKVLPRVPMRRWGKPEDFGAIAVYLVSDASSYHTGDSFVIDGAYTIF